MLKSTSTVLEENAQPKKILVKRRAPLGKHPTPRSGSFSSLTPFVGPRLAPRLPGYPIDRAPTGDVGPRAAVGLAVRGPHNRNTSAAHVGELRPSSFEPARSRGQVGRCPTSSAGVALLGRPVFVVGVVHPDVVARVTGIHLGRAQRTAAVRQVPLRFGWVLPS